MKEVPTWEEITEKRQAKRGLHDKIFENDFFSNSYRANIYCEFDTKMTTMFQL